MMGRSNLSCVHFFLMMLLVFVLQCSKAYTPEGWPVDKPKNHGLQLSLLKDAADKIGNIKERHSFVIIKNGNLIFEEYYTHDHKKMSTIWSVTKTFSSLVVGYAVTKKYFTVEDSVRRWVPRPYFRIAKGAQVKHLLSMTANYSPSGSRFRYSNLLTINTLSQVLEKATGVNSCEFSRKFYTEQLGIKNITIPCVLNRLQLGFGIKATAREVAKIGWIILNNGKWKGKRIISASYIKQMITPSFPQANTGYGYLIWLNNNLSNQTNGYKWRRVEESGYGKMIKDAPASLILATGWRGNLIYILPESKTVIVTLGFTHLLKGKKIFDTIHTARAVWSIMKEAL